MEKAWNEEACGLAFIKFYKKQAKTRETLRKWNKEVLGTVKSGSTFLWTGLLKFKRGSHLRIMAELNHIKINVDAALSSSKSTLAIVARNHLGEVLFVWDKGHHLCHPLYAEALALLWVVQIAIQNRWCFVIFEEDAKICFVALNHLKLVPNWNLNTIISNIRSLSFGFSSCLFCWVLRDYNFATHETARYALQPMYPFCFSNGNLPPAIEVACKGDTIACFPP
nr:hypothetical protein CFP56_20185 [Quercus suber]